MKILLHKHKYDNVYYDATDELWAFGKLFKSLDEFDAYCDVEDWKPKEKEAYYAAKRVDLRAARMLCMSRRYAEYEEYEIINVIGKE